MSPHMHVDRMGASLTRLRTTVAQTLRQDASTSGATRGTLWTGGGIVASTLASLVSSLVLVANSTLAVFADLAILTVGLTVLATVFRLGADRIFVGEVQAARDHLGGPSATQRGASLMAFSVLAGVVGGALVAVGPLSDLLNNALSTPLSGLERGMVGLWLTSDIARLVVGEGHRWGLKFKLAAFAGSGARVPLFLILVLCLLTSGSELTRERLLVAAAAASFTVFAISLLAVGRLFPWWTTNPFSSGRELWTGHSSMLATTLAATLIGAADVWIVGAAIGPESAARYAFAVSLVAGIAVVSSAISLGLTPYLAAGLRPEDSQRTSALVVGYTRIAGTLAVVIYGGLLLLAQPVAMRLGGNGYDGVLPLVALLGAGQLAGVLAGPGGTALIVARQYRLITSITIGVACLMLALTATAAWTSGSEVLVALASGVSTAALNWIGSVACQRRLGLIVHVLNRSTKQIDDTVERKEPMSREPESRPA